jgi:hypothetical protein
LTDFDSSLVDVVRANLAGKFPPDGLSFPESRTCAAAADVRARITHISVSGDADR